jgi:hypothetical protein
MRFFAPVYAPLGPFELPVGPYEPGRVLAREQAQGRLRAHMAGFRQIGGGSS